MATVNNKIDTRYAKAASNSAIEAAKESLEAKGFKVKVVDNLQKVRKVVEDLIPEGSEVFTATSVTLDTTKLTEILNSAKYISVRNKFMSLFGQKGKELEMRRIGSSSDYAIGSVHAITEDGQVVVASSSGSQLPNYAYGAGNVIWVVGAQKIVKDLAEAFDRIENYALHLEDERAKKAYGTGSSINRILIYRKDPTNRATVILVKEAIGF